MVECQLPKLDVAGSTPVARSKIFLEISNFQLPFFGVLAKITKSSQNVPISKVIALMQDR